MALGIVRFCCFFGLMLSLIAAQSDVCENDICVCDGGVVSCVNNDRFPRFMSTGWITDLIFVSVTFHTLPIPEAGQYGNLQRVVFNRCPYIGCDDVDVWLFRLPGVTFVLDFECLLPRPTPTTTTPATTVMSSFMHTSTPYGKTDVETTSSAARVTHSSQRTQATSTATAPVHGTDVESTSRKRSDSASESSVNTKLIASVLGVAATLLIITVITGAVYCWYKKYRNRVSKFVFELDELNTTATAINTSTTTMSNPAFV